MPAPVAFLQFQIRVKYLDGTYTLQEAHQLSWWFMVLINYKQFLPYIVLLIVLPIAPSIPPQI